jgi:polar amino acid transport system substrate-binding protein
MTKKTISKIAILAALATAAISGAPARADDHQQDQPLVVGSDFGVAPWMVRGVNGPEGFGVDLVQAIAKKVGRPSADIQDINFSGLFAALFSKRIEFTVNPLNITQERSEKMLYTEPFFATGNGFIVAKGTKLDGFDGLKGKTLAVNRGTISDTWATQNAEKYGFEIQRYETFPDSVQAVITHRAFTALNEIPTTVYAASKNPAIEVGFKDFNGRNFGYAFRYGDEAYRDKIESAIECLKQDGTMAKLYEKWYGEKAADGTSLTTIYAGYGAPSFKGYDEKPHELSCN